jgi:hypothetical protein
LVKYFLINNFKVFPYKYPSANAPGYFRDSLRPKNIAKLD